MDKHLIPEPRILRGLAVAIGKIRVRKNNMALVSSSLYPNPYTKNNKVKVKERYIKRGI